MKKMLFVMNPFAGVRHANRSLVDILAIFNRAGYDVSVHITNRQGDAARVTQQRANDVDLVVCAGGDGTLNETMNGLLCSGANIPLGYIPCGSTNDFAASLGLSTNVLKAAQEIVEGKPVSYDVGSFGGRYFSYVASFGAFTRASYATPQNVKNALGHAAYILGGVQELSQIHKEHVRVELEDQVIEDDFIFGAVSNATSLGGVLALDPRKVDMSDGFFELLLVRAPKDIVELHECILALQKQTYNCAMMTFLSTRKMTVYADPDMPWTLDGELENGHHKVEITNLHQAVRLMKKG